MADVLWETRKNLLVVNDRGGFHLLGRQRLTSAQNEQQFSGESDRYTYFQCACTYYVELQNLVYNAPAPQIQLYT